MTVLLLYLHDGIHAAMDVEHLLEHEAVKGLNLSVDRASHILEQTLLMIDMPGVTSKRGHVIILVELTKANDALSSYLILLLTSQPINKLEVRQRWCIFKLL